MGMCTASEMMQDHLHNLEIAAHYEDSENVQHNSRIAQISRLCETDTCISNHTAHEFYTLSEMLF